jgi:hypothetical protein
VSHESRTPSVAICTYRIKVGKEDEFIALLRRHWPTLRDLGMVDEEPSLVFRGTDESGGTVITEILTWKDINMPNRAHEIPSVMALWEPMGMCCEPRLGRPPMEFPQVLPMDLHRDDQGG